MYREMAKKKSTELAEKLAKAFWASPLSISDVAELVGRSQGYLWQIIEGDIRPTYKTLGEIAVALGLPPDHFGTPKKKGNPNMTLEEAAEAGYRFEEITHGFQVWNPEGRYYIVNIAQGTCDCSAGASKCKHYRLSKILWKLLGLGVKTGGNLT